MIGNLGMNLRGTNRRNEPDEGAAADRCGGCR